MKFVKRANEVLRVPDDAVDSYLNSGYDLLDDKGRKVIKRGKKASYTAAEFDALAAENEQLKKELEALKAEASKKSK